MDNQEIREEIDSAIKAHRPKYWSELSADEKADRMRGIVKDLIRDVARLTALVHILQTHKHDAQGDSMVSTHFAKQLVEKAEHPAQITRKEGDDVYF